ncbi:unnamed protein product [Spirodela intermedia]|uniref:Uncharacterized protein n=1 Tax=Spirodela intermedia TaxID=51605 RepID=A0A7I8I9E8_SPIIN|nr:unnamed protein product [Spirodela intermedia]CAA6654259.1 unnamed protein product [Spirodela intermedia]
MRRRGSGGDAPSSSSAAPPPPPRLSAAAQSVLRLLAARPSSSGLRQIHAQVLIHGLCRSTWVASSFIGACNSAQLLPYALFFFSHLPDKLHVFSSSRCLPVYSHLLRASVRPNNYTFPLVLKSLADLQLLAQGRSIHAHVVRAGHGGDIYVQNSMLNLYSSCGEMAACEQLFDEMRMRDAVSWTTIIEGYRKAGQLDEALVAFERMQFAGTAPNRVTVVNAVAACAARGALEMGVWIHDYVRRRGWELDVVMGTSLVDMYGKCGRAEDSLVVFSAMSERNVYTWNSLIRGLALAKSSEEALRWFSKMEKEGIQADAVTLIVALSACSHAGLVGAGRELFRKLLGGSFGFSAGVKHYGCMIDLLGRAGLLDEAVEVIEQMPFKTNPVVYGSLLSACRARGDAVLSSLAAEKLVELDPENTAYRILLSNSYAALGRWGEAEEVRRLMREKQLGKVQSWAAGSLVHTSKPPADPTMVS